MPTQSIPNLNTLRRGRGVTRGGLLSRANQGDKDATIRATDDDAASSRMSAVEAGYLNDPFAKYLAPENWQRRLPLMNRVDTFLSSSPERKQIVSLGAGSDTRYLRLKLAGKHNNFVYHEVDFQQNNSSKIERLRDSQCVEEVRNLCDIDLEEASIGEGELELAEYAIHAADLRKLPERLVWLDDTLPTLLISECCLIYLSPDQADHVLDYFSNMLGSVPLAVVIYEPFRPNDPFGRTMIRNLTTRGIVLQTIEKYFDLDKQRQRLHDHNLEARALDTNELWQHWASQEEKDRIERLEWMDEIEEFVLLAKHYCIAWGWRQFPDPTVWHMLPGPA
ncbi:carboxy methyl transferase for protein phosphatase 2A [Lithohypha guttulata]|uniref:carboxy methyl transferase for protein phosphatase 2A n=1 Tax=Lithohypha guttulata TaxID=1690604 RepID=UPI002DDE82F4|nr:carboxy methyl transferase for protein phosphatase 2A [Lithohypha guttulata]KAK5097908.1 carboxy methyl transferase for protein phosphatase 2A [Lithohypha guttulata]